jgi:hypothetical protein
MLKNYKLFIYEELDNSIRKYYWMQINNFDEEIVNDFNELDIEIKNGQEYPFNMIDMIDYNNGEVYILKYNN